MGTTWKLLLISLNAWTAMPEAVQEVAIYKSEKTCEAKAYELNKQYETNRFQCFPHSMYD